MTPATTDGASTSETQADVQATCCAVYVDEWVRHGMRHAVVAPGSRSTPMALALAGRADLQVHVAHDERTAAFVALGIGLSTGAPAALLCTSGTAATHFHAAVVEADLAGVPMLVLTGDRPPELHGIGAPQTIDQQDLYGDAVRLFVDAGVPDRAERGRWRSDAAGWWLAAVGADAGPVHVNLPFREPLVGRVGDLPVAMAIAAPDRDEWFLSPLEPEETVTVLDCPRGIIVAGRGVDDPAAVAALAASLGWPVLADPRSGCRSLEQAVCAFDPLLRHPGFAADHRPEVVVHLGEPPASKVLGQWLLGSGATHVQVHPQRRTIDPLGLITYRVHGEVSVWVGALAGAANWPVRAATASPWLVRWQHAERAAQQVLGCTLDADDAPATEPAVGRMLGSFDGVLVVSSSMPVRDVEWFGATSTTVVHSNRGANGIDGVIASAIGVAVGAAVPTVLLIGDVAFCHDQSSLTALRQRRLALTIVVVDNDGGGIFSFLPQASTLGAERFEQLFGTPHGTDLAMLSAAHGLRAVDVTSVGALRAAVADPSVQVVRVRSERARNVTDHDSLYRAVADALG